MGNEEGRKICRGEKGDEGGIEGREIIGNKGQ